MHPSSLFAVALAATALALPASETEVAGVTSSARELQKRQDRYAVSCENTSHGVNFEYFDSSCVFGGESIHSTIWYQCNMKSTTDPTVLDFDFGICREGFQCEMGVDEELRAQAYCVKQDSTEHIDIGPAGSDTITRDYSGSAGKWTTANVLLIAPLDTSQCQPVSSISIQPQGKDRSGNNVNFGPSGNCTDCCAVTTPVLPRGTSSFLIKLGLSSSFAGATLSLDTTSP